MIDETMPSPVKQGPFGRAWTCDMNALRQREGLDPSRDSGVETWIVEAPWAHPVWHSYVITLIHLRPMPGLEKAKIHLAGATHEFFLLALDPKYPRAPAVLGEDRVHFLRPANFAAQLVEEDDAAARVRIAATVDMIIAGQLSPDTDFFAHWIRLFGDAMVLKRQDASYG